MCVYNTEWDNAKHTCAIRFSFLVDFLSALKTLSWTVLRKTTNWFLRLLPIYKPLINPVTGLTTIAYLLFVWVFCFCFSGMFLSINTWLKKCDVFVVLLLATAAAASVSVFSQCHHGGFSSIIEHFNDIDVWLKSNMFPNGLVGASFKKSEWFAISCLHISYHF